jgi:hypothetical protein
MKKFFTLDNINISFLTIATVHTAFNYKELAFIPLCLITLYVKLDILLSRNSREVVFFDHVISDGAEYALTYIYPINKGFNIKNEKSSITMIKKINNIDYAGIYLLKD